MEDEEFETLKLRSNFQIEIELKNTRYPFARVTASMLIEKLKKDNQIFENKQKELEALKSRLDELAREHFKGKEEQLLTMMYCKEDELEKYKVYFVDGNLCFLRNEKFIKIDSENLFKEFFYKRSPEEDDLYLESIGFPSLPERKGKSCFSCFTIHKDGNLYINPYRQDTIQHTFTTNGENILCAGLLFIQNGKISYVDNRSGHYLSKPRHIQIFFDNISKNVGGENIKDFFSQEFDLFREKFIGTPINIIKNKNFGLNFYKFGEKNITELLEEKKIRNLINQRYFFVGKELLSIE